MSAIATATAATAAIRCTSLVKTYPGKTPVEAVRGLDLRVEIGECFGLLGPNGAGKTTTVEILEGLLPPTAGTVEILGQTWKDDAPRLRARIGVTLQETKLADKLTVAETLDLFASFYPRPRPVDETLHEVGLGEKRAAWVVNLSGGQRQRLAVACALIGDPELLFLDEPTTGLDPQSRRALWDLIRGLKQRGRTIVLTTHYMDEAERLCDRLAIVDHGQMIAQGTPRELILSLGGEHMVEFALQERPADAPGAPLESAELQALPTVNAVRSQDDGWLLTVREPHRTVPALLELLAQRGLNLSHLATRHASLEDVFVTLTGRHLRDE